VVALALALSECSNPEREGRSDAERDIAAGVLRLKTYGLYRPVPWRVEYERLMKERLRVELEPVPGCDVDDHLRRSAEGYNRRMEQEISKRFGSGAHDAILTEARKRAGAVGPGFSCPGAVMDPAITNGIYNPH